MNKMREQAEQIGKERKGICTSKIGQVNETHIGDRKRTKND